MQQVINSKKEVLFKGDLYECKEFIMDQFKIGSVSDLTITDCFDFEDEDDFSYKSEFQRSFPNGMLTPRNPKNSIFKR